MVILQNGVLLYENVNAIVKVVKPPICTVQDVLKLNYRKLCLSTLNLIKINKQ